MVQGICSPQLHQSENAAAKCPLAMHCQVSKASFGQCHNIISRGSWAEKQKFIAPWQEEASHRSFSRSERAAANRSSAMRLRLFSAASRPTSSSLPSITSATVAGPAFRSDACSTRVLARAVPDLARGPGGGGVSFISSCTASCTAPCCEPCTCTYNLGGVRSVGYHQTGDLQDSLKMFCAGPC